MVTFALALPVLILFASFVIDVGNWFEHQRHLQLQADAAALAAAGDFRYPCDEATKTAIRETAEQYAGVTEGGYNHQIGGTSPAQINFGLNSESYPEQQRVIGTPGPCETGWIDVKLTDTSRPLFFRIASLLEGEGPLIHAHARVKLFESTPSSTLPLDIPDVNPQKVRVEFIDEEHEDKVLGSRELTQEEKGENGLAIWDSLAKPLPLKVESGKIGVRVALSGSSSTTCGEPLVECYDAGSSNGILFARGYSMARSGAQPDPPLARSVYLLPAEGQSCNPYFSVGGCSVVLHAGVDFGPCEEPRELEEKVGPKLTAVSGRGSYKMKMTGCSGTSTSTSEWESEPIPVPAGEGPVPISLEWKETKGEEGGNKCTEGGGNKCKFPSGDSTSDQTFEEVQRSFAASKSRSGPIGRAEIEDSSGSWADSFERCSAVRTDCTYPVVVKIGVKQNLEEKNAESAEAPLVALRVFHKSEGEPSNPSQNQALDCEPQEPGESPKLEHEIAVGCAPKYTPNKGAECPAHETELWASPQPWECVAIQAGGDVNQIFWGMNERVFGEKEPEKCTWPNEWAKFPNLDYGNDPRIVSVFLTAFGSFSGSGNETVPVTGFATFYATGWTGNVKAGKTSQSICGTDELTENPEEEVESGMIFGHFIKYVGEGEPSEKPCEFESLMPCKPVLVE